jgi:hypothetical protein
MSISHRPWSLLAGFTLLTLAACSDDSGVATRGETDAPTDLRPRTQADGAEPDAVTDDVFPELDGDGADGGGDPDASADGQDGPLDSPVDMVAEDVAEDGDSSLPDAEEGLCEGEGFAYTATRVVDYNGDPIQVNDRLLISVELLADTTTTAGAVLEIRTNNLRVLAGTVNRCTGEAIGGEEACTESWPTAELSGNWIEVPLSAVGPARFTFEAEVIGDDQLILVLSRLDLTGEAACTVRRSQSGTILQVIGGFFKLPDCVDMRQVRTLQVAPFISKQNTSAYRTRNGEREDLLADDFIYCPQHPAIVHVAEFCIVTAAAQSLSLSGDYRSDGDWEVDDFMLVELFDGLRLEADGFTTQTHPGGSTFWCAENSTLMCSSGCQATLTAIADARPIDPLAVVSAVGTRPRRFDDGAVELSGLLPPGGGYRTMRITFLDVGIEGLLDPRLYLVSGAP